VRKELFAPTSEGEARLLLLIAGFSSGTGTLEGRTKLAKLDFLLRYPQYLARALEIRTQGQVSIEDEPPDLETPMVRYRYGPWDPAYFALLGALIGKGLVAVVPGSRGLGFKATPLGKRAATTLKSAPTWEHVADRISLLKRHFNVSGNFLKNFIYANFPEVAGSRMGDAL
jgi:hypothetical protein